MSAAKFWGIVGVVGAIVARSLQRLLAEADPWAGVKFFSWGARFWAALPIVVFGFQAHTNVGGGWVRQAAGGCVRRGLLMP